MFLSSAFLVLGLSASSGVTWDPGMNGMIQRTPWSKACISFPTCSKWCHAQAWTGSTLQSSLECYAEPEWSAGEHFTSQLPLLHPFQCEWEHLQQESQEWCSSPATSSCELTPNLLEEDVYRQQLLTDATPVFSGRSISCWLSLKHGSVLSLNVAQSEEPTNSWRSPGHFPSHFLLWNILFS